jgi:hypothetical protein
MRNCGFDDAAAKKDGEGKRRGQKRENRIFEMLPEAKMRFTELAEWYLDLKAVKKLASYDRVELSLRNFNEVYGNLQVRDIKLNDLQDYQAKREDDGLAPATIDMEISIAKTMVTKAFDNDLVGGRTVKTNMLAAGIDKAHRDVILGHSLQGMDVHYLVPSEESLRGAMDRYRRSLDNEILGVRRAAGVSKHF